MLDRKKLFGRTRIEWNLILCRQYIKNNSKYLGEMKYILDKQSVKEKRRLRYRRKAEVLENYKKL